MLPANTPSEDWPLYFHDTFMSHKTRGIGLVKVRTNDDGERHLKFYAVGVKGKMSGNSSIVKPDDLTIYWPRPGAYNIPAYETAIFVGRSAQRHMKRSASYDHYFITWAAVAMNMGGLVPYIAAHTKYTSITRFKTLSGDIVSRAVSNRVILNRMVGNNTEVIYMAELVGHLTTKNEFVPCIEFDSRTRRITEHLQEIGVIV